MPVFMVLLSITGMGVKREAAQFESHNDTEPVVYAGQHSASLPLGGGSNKPLSHFILESEMAP